MRNVRSMGGIGLAALLGVLSGCANDDGGTGGPFASGSYRGTYEVPTVTAELASAAVYDVSEVEWKVVGGQAELSYDLPLGLVGDRVRVEFSGPVGASGAPFTLTGAPGTAECTVAGGEVSCFEKMAGLLPLQPNYAVIESIAKTEYAGPPAHRIDVAKVFASDPIGVVRMDTSVGVTTDDDDHEEDDDD